MNTLTVGRWVNGSDIFRKLFIFIRNFKMIIPLDSITSILGIHEEKLCETQKMVYAKDVHCSGTYTSEEWKHVKMSINNELDKFAKKQ